MEWKWEYTVMLLMAIHIIFTGWLFVFSWIGAIVEEYIEESDWIQNIIIKVKSVFVPTLKG